ncbi:DNA-3-methyladenine glycosylase I [Crocinitomicaceae bacterium]|nr:DNA-3-methyladenine glycosylase I [Crocinitomicaceae bacterium]
MSYCNYCRQPGVKLIHQKYHDKFYGFRSIDDNELFGRLIMEINQAGLSWEIILKKEQNFRDAYANFDIHKVASFGDHERKVLLADLGIVRNKLKINAAIYNAQKIVFLKHEFGSFVNWLDVHHPLSIKEWVKLFKKTFKFVGGEIVNEFLLSTGYLPGAHEKSCPVFAEVLKTNPKWKEV